MARMIPATIHPNVQSQAEKRLFNAFRDAPGTDDWYCLHSLGMAHHARKRRGEIDFLLLTRKGIFVLEVKGGRIARHEGLWQFTDRYGKAHEKCESPFDQASSAMFAIELIVRLVIVQRLNYVIPIFPGERLRPVQFIAVRLRVANKIEPVPSPSLAIMW